MKINLAWWDRLIRYLLGLFLLTWGFTGGSWWSWPLGLYLLASASWGWCLFMVLLGWKTHSGNIQTDQQKKL